MFISDASPLNLFAHVLAEQAVRLDDQHHDQHAEHDRVGQLGGNVRLGEDLDDAEQHAADERARDGADAAEYGCGEGLNAGQRAGRRHQGRVGGAEQHACDRREARADGEGDGNGRVDVNAHQLRRALVLGYRAHRGADLALAGEQHERDHDDDAGRDGHDGDAGDLELTAEQADRAAADDRAETLRVGGPDQQRRILEEVGNADGGDQNGERRGRTQRLVGQSFDRHAEHRADNDREHDTHPCRPAEIGRRAEAHIAAYHDDIAVGKVQHFRNAVNHRIAQCDDRVDAAQTDAADQMVQKAHVWNTSNHISLKNCL